MIEYVLRIVVSLNLALYAWITLAVTDFNSQYIFPEYSSVQVRNVAEWYAFAQAHSSELTESMRAGTVGSGVLFVFGFYFMPVATVLSAGRNTRLALYVITAQAGLLIIDLNQLLSFPGAGQANGGYDIGPSYALHIAFAVVSLALCFYIGKVRLFRSRK